MYLGLLVILLMTSTQIASSPIETSQSLNTVVYAMPYDFNEYSPYTANSYATAQWQSAVINGLYARSNATDRDWAPDLAATLPTISLDKKTFTIDLKQGLVFSNGALLTADDVVFSFRVAMTPAINTNFYRQFVGFMNDDSVVKIDIDTVAITFLQTVPFPFTFLSIPLIPQETFGNIFFSCLAGTVADCVWDNQDLSFAIGAGPYKASSYDATNQVITLVKNSLYHGWNFATGNVDTLIFKKTVGKPAAIAELIEGTIDIMDSNYIPGLDELAFFSGIREAFVADPAHQEISLNHLHPMYGTGFGLPGNSAVTQADAWANALLVRTAMSHVLDREFAANEISSGLAKPAATPMPSASIGWDPTLIPLAFDINAAKLLMQQAGFDYSFLTDADNDGVYETFFFSITVMSPNANLALNEWSAGWVLELPKIGIGVTEHVSTGWAEIIPRTFGWTATGETLVPLYVDQGFDVLFVGYGWGIDYNPQGLYDKSGRHDVTVGGNFYNFDVDEVQSNIGRLVTDYLSELDFTARIIKVKLLQAELYKYKPVLPILYPQSHWGFNQELSGYDALLLSISALEWQNLRKGTSTFADATSSDSIIVSQQTSEGLTTITVTVSGQQTSEGLTTVTVTVTATDVVETSVAGPAGVPLPILAILAAIVITSFGAKYIKKRR